MSVWVVSISRINIAYVHKFITRKPTHELVMKNLCRTAQTILLDFIYSCIRSYEINKTNKLATKINSTESYTKVMDLKILPEPTNSLIMLQKKYQALFLPDQ